jgi:ribosomal protein S18 acetylase RimI-like enzyme
VLREANLKEQNRSLWESWLARSMILAGSSRRWISSFRMRNHGTKWIPRFRNSSSIRRHQKNRDTNFTAFVAESLEHRAAGASARIDSKILDSCQLTQFAFPKAFHKHVEMHVRTAEEREIDGLARLWYDGWQDAHAQILPVELRRVRTLDSFRQRLRTALPDTRVVGPPSGPSGFCITRGDELYQIYVSTQARGSGAAGALMADAEARLAKRGVETAWLACAIGNHRAARFYEKCGWCRVGVVTYQAETATGTFPLKVWRYEKRLTSVT